MKRLSICNAISKTNEIQFNFEGIFHQNPLRTVHKNEVVWDIYIGHHHDFRQKLRSKFPFADK